MATTASSSSEGELFLGIDLGTSSTKVVVMAADGTCLATNVSSRTPHHLDGVVSEQNPADWWSSVKEACKGLDDTLLKRCVAVSIAGQMHGAVILDESGTPLRPAILWNDSRCGKESDALNSIEGFNDRCMNLSMPGFTAAKLKWVSDNEPSIFERVRHVLLPKDYIVHRLTGRFCTEPSDASGTLLLDMKSCNWDPWLAAACGVPLSALPQVVGSSESVGTVTTEAAEELGFPPALQVVAGAADNAAAALGSGLSPGRGLVSLGTSGVVMVATRDPAPCPPKTVHCFRHCVQDVWYQMTVTLSATASLTWLCESTKGSLADVLAEIDDVFKTSSGYPRHGLVFLPYLVGERSPINQPNARGCFFGLCGSTTRGQMAVAVMEGVAMSLGDAFDALGEDVVNTCEEFDCVGGGSLSEFWPQMLANCIRKRIVVRDDSSRGAAFGAARLAQLGAAISNADRVRVKESWSAPPMVKVFTPSDDAAVCELWSKKRRIFKGLFESTAHLLNDLQ